MDTSTAITLIASAAAVVTSIVSLYFAVKAGRASRRIKQPEKELDWNRSPRHLFGRD
jgi:hypothetical protein